MTRNLFNDNQGKLKKSFLFLIIFGLILLMFFKMNSAENETENQEIIDSSEIIAENQESDALSDENNESSQSSQNEVVSSTEENITDISEETINETNQNNSENFSQENFGEITGEIISPAEQSEEETRKNISEYPFVDFDIEIILPERITRGETFTIKSTATNIGNVRADNVILAWQLPNGFELIQDDKTKDCGNILPNESCLFEVTIQSSLSLKLGKNEIKILVNHENQ